MIPRRVTLVVALACCGVAGTAQAQTSFFENLWSGNAEGAKKTPKAPETGKANPWQPLAPSQATPPKTTETPKTVAPPPSAAPAPTATPAKSASGPNWAVTCAPMGTQQTKTCMMVQNIVMAKTKQRLLAVTVRPRGQAGRYALVLSLPHGLYLPAGVQLKVDDKAPVKWVIQTADAKGSYAGGPLAEPLLGALKAGDTLKVSFAAANRKVVSVPVSLSGFTSAFAKLATAR